MRRTVPAMLALAGSFAPAIAPAQSMPGMAMPMPPARDHAPHPRIGQAKRANTTAPVAHPSAAAPNVKGAAEKGDRAMPAHDMASMSSMTGMPGMTHDENASLPQEGKAASGTSLPAGTASPPPAPPDHYADRLYPATAMAVARARMMREEGGQRFMQALLNLAEYQAGRDGGYRWDAEAWAGGDIDRAVIRTEGSGSRRDGVEDAELQALYSHAIGPYFAVQGGVRQDFQPRPTRSYASIGVEGGAPFMVETEARLFVSTHGEVLGRVEAWYDQRLTQRAVLQPRVELNLSAQDVPRRAIGAGLTDAELGVRLRYEISRRFAPYVGVSTVARTGRSADYARAEGAAATTTSFVAGIRAWF